MKLTYYDATPPNFGDAINATMWSHLLPPGFLDDDADELFLGVGSILWDYLPRTARKHVAGSGFGGYTLPPDMDDGSWSVIWLRGPITAECVGLDPALAIADAAVLLPETPLPAPAPDTGIAFMPHFESVARGNWQAACTLSGITYLDPRDDTATLLSRIRGARVVIAEAMHGAIVSDALRTPWIAAMPFHPQHRLKWQDWSLSLEIALRPVKLCPSTLLEGYTFATGNLGKGARSRRLFNARAVAPVNRMIAEVAARRLMRIAETVEPQLSDDRQIRRATGRCLAALDGFVRQRVAA
ncbi:MAG: polysaccharide pyruvyl transferase family protein [Silicimonas sp.]|nr:polysaccharide pyruvyl transferase family protein [Silicimonas sp.]